MLLRKGIYPYEYMDSLEKKPSWYLIGIFYQPNSIEHEKWEWLDHFEVIIANASLKWKGVASSYSWF